VGLLIFAGLAAYHNSFDIPFLFDDLGNIVYNPHIRRLWPLGEVLFGPSNIGVAGRPIVNLTFALNYAIGRLSV
jgi:hypothetical protein